MDFYALALEIKKITDSYGIPLVINDRIDIAMAVGAAGVHIGQKDIPADIARKVIGKDMLLGVSAGSAAEAVNAVEAGADYLGVGAMFPTGTKRGKEYSDVFELAAYKVGVHPKHCIVFDDVLPAIKSAKRAGMLVCGVYDKYSEHHRIEIEKIADGYLFDWRYAPLPDRGK